jgi:hypothetical protein
MRLLTNTENLSLSLVALKGCYGDGSRVISFTEEALQRSLDMADDLTRQWQLGADRYRSSNPARADDQSVYQFEGDR